MRRVVADSWYAAELAERLPGVVTAESMVPRRLPPILRALALVARTDRDDVVVTTNPSPGTRTLIAATGLLGRGNLVLLEYIAHPPSGVRRIAFHVLRRVLLPRALTAAQVLTEAERDRCARSHGVSLDVFRFVPWPGRSEPGGGFPGTDSNGRRVLASGRRTDWATVLAAAGDADWDVTAVCTRADGPDVRARAGRATVLVDISADEHAEQVRLADVYVVALPETGASIGQIRIMNAADAGTALVISDVTGVTSYVDDTCAVLIPPADPDALRGAVDALLDDPARRATMARALFDRGSTRTMTDYLSDVAALVRRIAA